MAETFGTCALCQKDKALVQSHIMPKSMYKKTAQAAEPNANDLVLSDFNKNVAFTTSKQHRERLLCQSCENKFNTLGEGYLARHCFQGSKDFPIRDLLSGVVPTTTEKGREIWHGENVSDSVDIHKIKYFALSVLWRHSVCKTDHQSGNQKYRGALGKKYEEHIRSYLNEERDFPTGIFFLVYVDFDAQPIPILQPPSSERSELLGHRFFLHSFTIPGLRIRTHIGGNVQTLNKKLKSDLTFFRWGMRDTEYLKQIIKKTGELQPKGKFAFESDSS